MSVRSLQENPYLRELEVEEEFKLQTPHNIELFQYFITFKNEIGIYRCAGDWFCRVGDYGGIFLENLSPTTDVVVHTHPRASDAFHCIPTPHDFIHAHSINARFFVVSPLGIARFWPLSLKVKESERELKTYMELYAMGERLSVFPWQKEEFKSQMQEKGCRWEMSIWEEIGSDDKLLHLLVDKNPIN